MNFDGGVCSRAFVNLSARTKCFSLAILISGTFATLGSALAADAPDARTAIGPSIVRPHRLPKILGRRFDGVVATDIWSGYAVKGTGCTDIKGSWTVPTVDCSVTASLPGDATYSAFWVGIDGYGNTSLEQIGTDADCIGNAPLYFAWCEILPAAGTPIYSMTISAGDQMFAEVSYNGSVFTFNIIDKTTNASFTTTAAVPASPRTTAEWIAEAPTDAKTLQVLPLSHFDTGLFGMDLTAVSGTNEATDSTVSGPIGSFGSAMDVIAMETETDDFESVPSGLFPDGLSFYVYGPRQARYLWTDTLTEGAWNGTYGLDGYLLAGPPRGEKLPSYLTVRVPGGVLCDYIWAGTSTDPRALQNSAGAVIGIAAAYMGCNQYTGYINNTSPMSFNFDFTDGHSHRVALYLLDWDTNTRAETVKITNASTGAVLDTETYSSFHNGEYAIWDLAGNVIITITPTGGASAAVSGFLFGFAGEASVPPLIGSTAVWAGLDTSTQGDWIGKYGAHGYMIPNGPSSPATYANANVTGDLTYTWAGSTTDVRALTNPKSPTTRIASAYTQYAGVSYTFNVDIVDGNTHQVALYLLDWDTSSRSEIITIKDIVTGTVLDTRTIPPPPPANFIPPIPGPSTSTMESMLSGTSPETRP